MVSDIQKLIEAGKKYIEVKIELLKLDAQEEMSHYLMKSSILLGGMVTFLIIIVFLAIGFALYLNTYFEHNYHGFFIVAGIFALLIFLLFIFRNSKLLHRIFHSILHLFIFDKNE